MKVAGPVWLGPLVEGSFCKSMINGMDVIERRSLKLLQTLHEEADSAPCYFIADKVCDKLNLPIPPKDSILFELRKLGHRATGTHFHPAGIKTDASIQELKEILFSLT